MQKRIYLNDHWRFTDKFKEELLREEYNTDSLEEIRLPHTCKELPYHYFDEHEYQMVCGYCRIVDAPEEWREKEVLLTIDGAAHDSDVYLNGTKVGEHHCGYTSFTIRLNDFLVFGGKNKLVIKVDSQEKLNIPPFGYVIDYMTYGGIYRDVYLEIKNETYLEDVFVKPIIQIEGMRQQEIKDSKSKLYTKKASAELLSKICLNRNKTQLYVRQSLRKCSESRTDRTTDENEYQLLGETKIQEGKNELNFQVDEVELWDTTNPALYELKTELLENGTAIDEKVVRFGFRKAEFKADGFYLNGTKLKLRGLNRHQSFPYVGYAMPESMQKWDADLLKKELGLNAVRTSHYPQSHYFLDRCDEIGLLVFTEIPGWQHIGDAAWKDQAVENVKDMVLQYRNHTSIILWGVRINESKDDDEFYKRTNEMAHQLDDTRATGGVRCHKKSSLLEDVYTYNDFVHAGDNKGCEPKKNVTSDEKKAYLISEYNGHMYPTKSFDWEEHRVEHAMRHARVLDAVMAEEDIAGCFGWCMFDYNTHKDFGSGDRICYHGIMDMFRNPKLAAVIYQCQQEKEPILELSSSMDIGEHPGCNRGSTYIFTNADSVRMYKNDRFIKEYTNADSPYSNLAHGPILIDDFIGTAMEEMEHFPKKQADGVKKALNATARYGLANLPKSIYLTGLHLILRYHMKPTEAVELYNKYIGDWGGTSTSYRFEAIKDGKVVKTITKEPMTSLHLAAEADHLMLKEKNSYDVAAIRIKAMDENQNILSFFEEPVTLSVEGPIELIGPKVTSLRGGMGGTYVKTTGNSGKAVLHIQSEQAKEIKIEFTCE